MKIAIYPGSFNPFHAGHGDVITKGLQIFDKIIIAPGHNPEKLGEDVQRVLNIRELYKHDERIEVFAFSTLLVDCLKDKNITAIIKGIRDTNDFLYEQKMQYWNEDLGVTIPTVYIISDRELVHMSSSAFRSLEKFK